MGKTKKKQAKPEAAREVIARSAGELREAVLDALRAHGPMKAMPLFNLLKCADRYALMRAIDTLQHQGKVQANRNLGGVTFGIAIQADGLTNLYCPPLKRAPGKTRHYDWRHVKVEPRPATTGYASPLNSEYLA